MSPWVLTWEGTNSQITSDNKIVGILSGRSSSDSVEKIVDFIYHRTQHNVESMEYYLNRSKERKERSKSFFSNSYRIYYGTANCFLYARKVKNFRVEIDESRDLEIVSWIDPAYVENDKEVEPEKPKTISRSRSLPMSLELH